MFKLTLFIFTKVRKILFGVVKKTKKIKKNKIYLLKSPKIK